MARGFAKALDIEEVERVIALSERDSRKKIEFWPAKEAYPGILEAMETDQKTLTIQGTKFYLIDRGNGQYFVKPTTGYAPCGEFSLEGVQKEVDLLGQDA